VPRLFAGISTSLLQCHYRYFNHLACRLFVCVFIQHVTSHSSCCSVSSWSSNVVICLYVFKLCHLSLSPALGASARLIVAIVPRPCRIRPPSAFLHQDLISYHYSSCLSQLSFSYSGTETYPATSDNDAAISVANSIVSSCYLCDLLHYHQPARTLRSFSQLLLYQPVTRINFQS